MAAHLEFVGLACFRVWSDVGPALVTDPPQGHLLGWPYLGRDEQLDGEIVIASSFEDEAHFDPHRVRGDPALYNAIDLASGARNLEIEGTPVLAQEWAETATAEHIEGSRRNAMYAFRVGGVGFVHQGDIGTGLPRELVEPFKPYCDVLLALVGEGFTLSLADLDDMIEILDPTWIVPMHYDMPGMMRGLVGSVDGFLAHRARDPIVFPRGSTATFPLEAPELGRPTIVVLRPSGVAADVSATVTESPAA